MEARMTELEMYRYIHEDLEPEMRWNGEELIVFLYHFQLEDFMKQMNCCGMFDDEPMTVWLRSTYLVVDLVPFCEHHDIEPESILPKKGGL
jgi:hypothetical protein